MSDDTIYAWHCVQADGTTRWLKKPEVVGARYTVEGGVIPCENGLHASVNPLDALDYGDYDGRMKRVLLEGAVPHGAPVDKYAGRARTTLFELMPEQTVPVLHAFAFWCVEEVARPAAISALRDAGFMDQAATLEALPTVVDTASARAFRTAAYAAAYAAACAADYNAANAAGAAYAAYHAANAAAYAADCAAAHAAGASACDAANAVARAAAYAAGASACDADYAAHAAARADTKERAGNELTRRLLEFAPGNYTENKDRGVRP